jgi:hypothetical protein
MKFNKRIKLLLDKIFKKEKKIEEKKKKKKKRKTI